jgi:hypothetical protein
MSKNKRGNDMNNSWIEQTMELIEDWEREKTRLEASLENMKTELYGLNQKISTAHALIQAYIDKHNLVSSPIENIRPGYFANKTYPEMLVEIAQKRQGYLKVADAVEIMREANVSTDRRLIQANVYSALRRMRKQFVKMARGEYRYTNHAEKTNDVKPSGVKQIVKFLKERNPEATKLDILRMLVQRNFDFKGKNPKRAVHMAWISLGYGKEKSQLTLAEAIPIPEKTQIFKDLSKPKVKGYTLTDSGWMEKE